MREFPPLEFPNEPLDFSSLLKILGNRKSRQLCVKKTKKRLAPHIVLSEAICNLESRSNFEVPIDLIRLSSKGRHQAAPSTEKMNKSRC